MKNYFEWVSKYRIDELCKSFFINCGVLFVMSNISNRFWPTEREVFGGFLGQISFAIVIAIAVTYFSGRNSPIGSEKNDTEKIT